MVHTKLLVGKPKKVDNLTDLGVVGNLILELGCEDVKLIHGI
jgi:hypothetical protein